MLSKDPIGFVGGDLNLYAYVDSVGKPYLDTNLYAYGQNNPINRRDPSGLQPILPAPVGPGYYGGGPGQTVGGVFGWFAGAAIGAYVGAGVGLEVGMSYGALIGLPAGPLGSFAGALVGGFAGTAIGGVVGGVGGGFAGRWVGHQFDAPCAGLLNCGEEEMLKALRQQQQKAPCK